MDIRPAEIDDLRAVERLRMEAFSGDSGSWSGLPPETVLDMRLALWNGSVHLLPHVLVVVDDARVIGTSMICTAGTLPRLPRPPAAFVRGMGVRRTARFLVDSVANHYEPGPDEAYQYAGTVAPSHRGRGVMRALIAANEEWAVARGKREITAIVDRRNAPQLRNMTIMGYRLEPPERSALRRRLAGESSLLRAVKSLVAAPE